MDTTVGRSSENRWIMVTLSLSMLLASLGTSIANIALPELSRAFAASFSEVQWVVIAYLATVTVFVVLAGRLGDIYGLRRMHIAGLSLFVVASLLCGLAPNLWALIAARALQGAGAAFLMAITIALVRETIGDERTGRAMGLLGTMSALGTALGPSLGGLLLGTVGWQGIFLILVPFGLLALLPSGRSLPRDERTAKPAPAGFAALRNGGLLSSLAVNILVAAVMMTTLVVGPFYLKLGLGLDDMLVGLVMSVGPLLSIFSGVPSGHAVDSWGARCILAAGIVMLGAGAFLLSVLPQMLGVGGYVIAIAVLTPGYQLFQAANNTAVMARVAKEHRGTISGLLSLSRNVGLILGASAMGAVFAFGVGTSEFQQATIAAMDAGLRLAFIVAGALMVVALLLSRMAGREAR